MMSSTQNSNDVVDLNSHENDDIMCENADSEKPILELFKKLILSNNRNNIVLKNAHIEDILHKEFNIIISKIHELEGDIYINVTKKFLKDWPQWDDFDKTMNEFKQKKDYASIKMLLQTYYIELKRYLHYILDNTKDIAKNTVKKALEKEAANKMDNSDGKDEKNVVLEVCASRNQLNQLFFREPNPEFNNTIFNSTYRVPTHISCDTLPLEAILNWWGVCIGIATTKNVWIYKRETIHELKHVLVNQKLTPSFDPLKVLDQDLKMSSGARLTKIDKSNFVTFIDNMSSKFLHAKYIFEFIKKDLKLLPDTLYSRASYKRYTNKYPYVRYLYKDTAIQDKDKNDTRDKKYDIQLKETVSPQYKTYIGKIFGLKKKIVIQCLPCSYTPSETNLFEDLKSHFYEHHNLEPDWKCSNCSRSFSMAYLAQNWWTHRC